MINRYSLFTLIIFIFAVTAVFSTCAPQKPEPVKVGGIPDNEFNPEEWGKVYPLHYESWSKTKDPKPAGKSKYRRGWDDDRIVYDRISEFPYSALLYNGWGFGIEYNEPRGHYYAVIDQLEIDQSRTKPGGVCLSCKSPYHKTFVREKGTAYLKAKFNDAVAMIPEKNRKLGPACIDCHKPATMGLTVNKWHIEKGLNMLGKAGLSRQEQRLVACGQCHMSYYVPRDKEMKVVDDVRPPWTGSRWGAISIENIIKDLLSDFQRIEWVQSVSGFRMPFIRHPEFEFYTNNSVHFTAGAACPDCHMSYSRAGSYKISDHNVTSPLKKEMKACAQCHTESAVWLKEQVSAIQDRTASLISRAGYGTATSARLFEILHKEQKKGLKADEALLKKAEEYYKNAFLRLVFINAENSTGFHNPSEAGRVLGDAVAFASKSEGLLRQILAKGGISLPVKIGLDLNMYLNGRGQKKLNFRKEHELADPYGLQKEFTDVP